MKRPDELRTYSTTLVLRDVDATGGAGRPYQYLEGRAVPYDTWANLGYFLERHAGGSFGQSTKAGSGRALPLLLFHDNRSWPVGHAAEWRHDDGGLDGIWKLNESPEAQRAGRMADDGDLVGLSIGFQPIRSDVDLADKWNPELGPEHMDRVTRIESRLLETSLTPTPAFADAGVTLVRSAYRRPEPDRRELEGWRAAVEGLRSGLQ
jgi:HK97 family phage prohead protease